MPTLTYRRAPSARSSRAGAGSSFVPNLPPVDVRGGRLGTSADSALLLHLDSLGRLGRTALAPLVDVLLEVACAGTARLRFAEGLRTRRVAADPPRVARGRSPAARWRPTDPFLVSKIAGHSTPSILERLRRDRTLAVLGDLHRVRSPTPSRMHHLTPIALGTAVHSGTITAPRPCSTTHAGEAHHRRE